jgi:hypothetical protein
MLTNIQKNVQIKKNPKSQTKIFLEIAKSTNLLIIQLLQLSKTSNDILAGIYQKCLTNFYCNKNFFFI